MKRQHDVLTVSGKRLKLDLRSTTTVGDAKLPISVLLGVRRDGFNIISSDGSELSDGDLVPPGSITVVCLDMVLKALLAASGVVDFVELIKCTRLILPGRELSALPDTFGALEALQEFCAT